MKQEYNNEKNENTRDQFGIWRTGHPPNYEDIKRWHKNNNELGLQPFTINDPGSLSGVPKKYLVR